MSKGLLGFVIYVVLIIYVAYSNRSVITGTPPKVQIYIDDKPRDTKLGTYCWKGLMSHKCVETVGPIELLEGENPIVVKPNQTIEIRVNSRSKPNEYTLSIINGEIEKNVTLNKNLFHAPNERGIYYYVYRAWWMDENRQNISNGDAFYAFVLKVE